MESHPVPQNVTAFEFHLIGNMTMRQFGYLAASLVVAYAIFLLFSAAIPFIAYPVIAIVVGIGAAYAFLPIMDRPLDHWTAAFIKAITKPTLRKYESTRLGSQDPKFKNRLNIYLQQIQAAEAKKPKKSGSLSIHPVISGPQPSPEEEPVLQQAEEPKAAEDPTPSLELQPPVKPVEEAEEPEKTAAPIEPQAEVKKEPADAAVYNFLNDLDTLAKQQPTQTAPETPQKLETLPEANLPSTEDLLTAPVPTKPGELPTEEDLDKTVQLARQAQGVQNQIIAAEKQIDSIKSTAAQASVDPKQYTQEFQSVLTTLQKLNQKAREISHDLAQLSSAEKPNTLVNEPATKPNIIPTLTLTQIPNILNGIVTDAQGNYIEGAIIVAHDKQGLPVRALKTNKLGQFIAATPLSSGTYTISVEKDELAFDVIQVELNDKVLNPVVISAKKGA